MAIVFLEQRQKQQYLLIILLATVILIPIIVWQVFFVARRPPVKPTVLSKPQKIEINLTALKNPTLKELQAFEAIQPFKNGVGRRNPFAPY